MKKKQVDHKGFISPENYFSDFEKHLQRRIKLAESLPKNSGFVIPKDYFEQWEAAVNTPISRKTKRRLKYWPWAGVAAAILLGVLLWPSTAEPTPTPVEQLSDIDISNFIDDGFLNFSTYELLDSFEEVPLDQIELSTSIPKEAIIEYLNERNFEDYTLTTE